MCPALPRNRERQPGQRALRCQSLEDRRYAMAAPPVYGFCRLFAGLALLLVTPGIYGVTFDVGGQRTTRVASRIALGATNGMCCGSCSRGGNGPARRRHRRCRRAGPRTYGFNSLVGGSAPNPHRFLGVATLLVVCPWRRADSGAAGDAIDPLVALRYE